MFHMGSSKKGLAPLYAILENSDVPMNKLLPTHVNRSETLFDAAIEFALKGGHIDITSGIPLGRLPLLRRLSAPWSAVLRLICFP